MALRPCILLRAPEASGVQRWLRACILRRGVRGILPPMRTEVRLDPTGQSQPYEVRCHRCHCSFAPGTRQCLHCGGPLSLPGQAPFVLGAGAPGGSADEAETAPPSFARALLWLVSAGLAIALSALRACSER